VFYRIRTRDDRLILGPHWPKSLGPIGFAFVYRSQRLHLRISGRAGELTSEAGNTGRVLVECRGRVQHLLPGHTIEVA
jgi:alpha,alpha-trehalase